jgi:hypothetical protein
MPLRANGTTAFGPSSFVDGAPKTIPLARGYSGTCIVHEPDRESCLVGLGGDVAADQDRRLPDSGDVQVCGTAAPNAPLRIHDMSSDTQDVVVGTGSVDSAGGSARRSRRWSRVR